MRLAFALLLLACDPAPGLLEQPDAGQDVMDAPMNIDVASDVGHDECCQACTDGYLSCSDICFATLTGLDLQLCLFQCNVDEVACSHECGMPRCPIPPGVET